MIITALGDTDAIGASCYYVQIGETGLALDAGADPDEDGLASLPRFEVIYGRLDGYIDHVLVTHAHHDHIGSLPVLIEQFPRVLVHMTRATRELADFVLPASARLQRRRQREGSSPHAPLFDEKTVEVQSFLYLTHELERPFDVTALRGDIPVTAQFYNAGHLLGAAGVLLSFAENGTDRRVFYTSDTCLRSQSIIPGGSYPEAPLDVLILESTLGADPDAEQTTRRTEEKRFGAAMQRVIARGGSVLVPVFALGRAQEMLALIDRFKDRGLLPADVPVYTAGGLRAVSELYDKTRFVTPRLNPDFQVYDVDQRRLPRSYAAKKNTFREPGIYVVSSGMMFENTLSNWVAKHLVEDEDAAIFLVGFSKEDTPGARLLEAAEQDADEVVLDATVGPQPLRCEVGRFRFSGHSHRRDLLQLVEKLRPSRVVLVHGESTARAWMADNIRFFHPHIDIVLPELGEPVEV